MRQAGTAGIVAATAAALVFVAMALPMGSGVGPQSGTVLVNGHEAVAGEALVKFRTRPAPGEVEKAVDADASREVGNGNVRRLHSRSLDTRGLVNALQRRGDVEYAEPNYVLHAALVPGDPAFASLWGLLNTGQTIGGQAGVAGADISADAAWGLSTGSKANVVAVVDTGVDYTHPDLAANIWSAPSSFSVTLGGQTIACAAGTHGFNAVAGTCDPMDDNNHGTHVSGTIGGVGNNGVGVVGVNWSASIMGAKFLDKSGSGTTADAVNAIEFAIQVKQKFGALANVRVLSNSWGGGGFSQTLSNEIASANTAGMVFVAAAGNNASSNDTTPFYPASYAVSNVVAVAATDNRDQLASFSNYGASTVDLGAPGSYIYSTLPGNSYGWMSGTSMATPHVSGAAALLLSYCPALDTSGVISTLLQSVDKVAALSGTTVSGGRLNVYNALKACAPASPDFTVSVSPASQAVTAGANASYNVTVNATGGYAGQPGWSVSGAPGAAVFSPASGGPSTLVVSTAGAPAGTYTLTITGTDGTLVRTAQATLVVSAPAQPGFSLSLNPSSVTIKRRSSGSVTVSIAAAGGFAGTVSFTISGVPANTTAAFSPTSVPGSGTATLTLTPGGAAVRGNYNLTVVGASGSISHSAVLQLKIR